MRAARRLPVRVLDGFGLTSIALIEFGSYEQAVAGYNSEEYQVRIASRWSPSEVEVSVQEGADAAG